jgi:tRNA threonylcarbamoyl adenosine modification protein YeaZ
MNILAVDTALAACSAAVFDSDAGRLLVERLEPMLTGHAERLAPMVQETMADAGLSFIALNRIATTMGPGTFTGLRIGLSFARGLGLALGLPVVGISTLKAIAANVTANPQQLSILAAIDARRGNCYLQLFTADLSPLFDPQVCSIAEASIFIPPGRHLVVGTAASMLISHIDPARTKLLKADAQDLPTAAAVARLASLETPSLLPPEPLYLRPPDAKPQPGPRPSLDMIEAVANDAEPLAALHSQCFPQGWSAKAIAEVIAMPGSLTLMACAGRSDPVGFVIARRAADESEILTLCVAPAYRRRHIAARLVREVAGRLASAGVLSLHIEVSELNAAALDLYGKVGFKKRGTRRGYYESPGGSPEDAVIMTCPLAIAPQEL